MERRIVSEQEKYSQENRRYEEKWPVRHQRNHRGKDPKETAGSTNQEVAVTMFRYHAIGNPAAAKSSGRARHQTHASEDDAGGCVAQMFVARQHQRSPGCESTQDKGECRIAGS